MTTTVVGKESGRKIVVEKAEAFVPTGNPYYTLYIRGDDESGEVSLRFSIGRLIFPFSLSPFEEVRRVDEEHPDSGIWDANGEYLDIHFTKPKP